jgi:RimJ/RimL family protein N-acetyltransferase
LKLEIIPILSDKTSEIYNSEDCQQVLKIYEEYYPKIGFNIPWVGYFIIQNNKVVGCCGFTGQPNDRKVEIAYWTFDKFKGQGLASFACKKLISIAQIADPALIITAKTAPEHNASTKILQKNNFTFSGVVQDDEIGDAWFWILNT